MARITGNRLLFLSLLGFIIYWVVGLAAPKPYIASLASLMLLILSGMTLWRWGPTAWTIVVRGRRSAEAGAEGSHLAVYGTSLVALGLHYTAWYRLAYVAASSPMNWSNSAYSSAGVATAAVGLTLLYFSPDVSKTEMKTPNTLWLALAIVLGITGVFFIGKKSGQMDADYRATSNIPGCPDARPVLGTRSKIYHMPDSRFRWMVMPERCFKDEDEAKAAGFRNPH